MKHPNLTRADELIREVTAELASGQIDSETIELSLTELNEAQSWLMDQIDQELRRARESSQPAQSSADPSESSSGWSTILEALDAPVELARGLDEAARQYQGLQRVLGDHPVDGWGHCYAYFEALREHVESIDAITTLVIDNPEYLPKALQALKLRALSKSVQTDL